MTIHVGILGLSGKMGQLCAGMCMDDLVLVGGTGRATGDAGALAADCDVVVDFTHGETVERHAAALTPHRAAWVCGNSGVTVAGRAAMAAAAARIPVLYAANFSLGMNVLLLLAERLGRALPGADYDAEIIDIFHRRKVDAPSGTALEIGRAVARGRGTTLEGNTEIGRVGHVGVRKTGAIGFSSLRGGAVAGENTLLMTGRAEQSALTHRVNNPRVYAKGAMRAVRWVHGKPPGLYGMPDVLA